MNQAGSSASIKAVILAAGKGTRMRELTNDVPKPMLKIQGKPILEWILEGLLATGINEACIITGYRAEAIESYFHDGARWGAKIEYARQEVQDGTGKAPELAKEFVGPNRFLLTYGDILVKPDTYATMVLRLTDGDFAGVISVTRGEDVAKGGLNFFDDQFCLKRVVEKPGSDQIQQFQREGLLQAGQPVWYNAGIYIFDPVVFDFTARLVKSARGEYELPDAVNAMIQAGHRIAGVEIVGRWVDVRDPEVLAELEDQTEGSL